MVLPIHCPLQDSPKPHTFPPSRFTGMALRIGGTKGKDQGFRKEQFTGKRNEIRK